MTKTKSLHKLHNVWLLLLNDSISLQDKIIAIHEAVETGNLEEVKANLTRKKYALAKDRQTGASILHKAVVYGHIDILR